MRELTGPEGEFYCAQDADSEGQEGNTICFQNRSWKNVLAIGGTALPWVRHNGTGKFEGKNIPNLIGNSRWFEEPPDTEELREYRGEDAAAYGRQSADLVEWVDGGIIRGGLQRIRSGAISTAALRAEQFITNRLAGKGRLLCATETGEAAELGCWTIMHFSAVRFWKCTGSHLTWNFWKKPLFGRM